MCVYRYTDKDSLEEYCELLDKPCNEETLALCPLLSE